MEYILKGEDIPEHLRTDDIIRQVDEEGTSMVMQWIQVSKKDIPNYLMFPNFQKHLNKNKQNAAMYWIVNRLKDEIPQYLLYDDCEKQIDCWGWNLAMYWIGFRLSPFPNWMIYPGMGRCYDIESRKTSSMLYMEHIHLPPPQCLNFDGIIHHLDAGNNNFTAYWAMYVSDNNPPYFIPNGRIFSKNEDKMFLKDINIDIVNKFNQTPQLFWLISKQKPLPEWLIYAGMEKHIYNGGHNLAMAWVKILKKQPPKYLYYTGIQQHVNNKDQTLQYIINKYVKQPRHKIT